jgi:hypothetical protein
VNGCFPTSHPRVDNIVSVWVVSTLTRDVKYIFLRFKDVVLQEHNLNLGKTYVLNSNFGQVSNRVRSKVFNFFN